METVSAGVSDYKARAGRVRMIDVAVVGPDGVERHVREPLFDDSTADGEGVDYDEFHGLMGEAGFQQSTTRWSDLDALENSGERCDCGGVLAARSYRRDDPLCLRAFAVCGMCGRVAFEY
jgi:hypothetical protein